MAESHSVSPENFPLMSVEDFVPNPDWARILELQIYRTNSDLISDLEVYKFLTREELLEALREIFPDSIMEDVKEVSRKDEFTAIEVQHSVLIDYVSNKSVRIVKSLFSPINLTALELALTQFQEITVVNTTEVNFRQLTEWQWEPDYDPIVLFKRILVEVIALGGTDLHFSVVHKDMKAFYPIKYRVNGDLFDLNLFTLTQDLNKAIISNLVEMKTSANSLDLALAEGVTTNSSDILGNANVELRIAANKVKDGLQCVIRIQEKKTFSFSIGSLGFSESAQDFLHWLSKKRSGITLITGAIRTGKNTTAFSLANEMINKPIKLIDYSSPIEVLMPFDQVDYLADESRLLSCVKLAKKQDVNVAFLNEIPSKEVAFAVKDLVNSSIHVITTIHMDRIWHLPYKLNEYYGESYKDVISQINGVMNQKMFDVMCPDCQVEKSVSSIEDRAQRDFLFSHGIEKVKVSCGCEKCRTSYKVGSIPGANQPYVEFLKFTDSLKSRLLSCEHAWEMEQVIKEEVVKGATSLENSMLDGIKNGKLNYETLDFIL